MLKKEAWLYAASWGSLIRSGDPGACLYGFDETFVVQSERHREDCRQEMIKNRAYVEAHPDGYEPDELDQIDEFLEALSNAERAAA